MSVSSRLASSRLVRQMGRGKIRTVSKPASGCERVARVLQGPNRMRSRWMRQASQV
ncbi:hypothetical protein UVI_02047170 [Ustilaginoidea virens]|uniref:Uncharacterized protein n=1 Tax=Ustilaginoidea virens TaxID=1159556 RepID=A0A1B5L589_USTVR|nr:hypothetical protein UVI_02047170 [Ustilaginoidea virens]